MRHGHGLMAEFEMSRAHRFTRIIPLTGDRVLALIQGPILPMKKRRSTHHFRNMSFANRVATTWNELPDHVVSAPSTSAFKKRLDRHWATLVDH